MTIISNLYTQDAWEGEKQFLIDEMTGSGMSAVLQVYAKKDLVLDVGEWDASIGIYEAKGCTITILGTEVYGWAAAGEIHLVGSGYIAPQGATIHLYGECRFDARYLQDETDPRFAGVLIRHDEELPAHLR